MRSHIQIFIVEDEPDIQTLIEMNLDLAGYHQHQSFDTIQAAHNSIKEQLPQLLLIDWMLPDGSGIELIHHIRQNARTKDLPIIMLTAKSEENDKIKGLEVGADDYITKPFSPKELIARIQSLLRRRAPQLSDSQIRIGHLEIDPQLHQVQYQGESVQLGPTECKILVFFATHPERVFSRNQLLDAIWGDHVFIEERTIDVHIRRLRNQLKPFGCEQILETVRGSGYRLSLATLKEPQ